MAGVVFTDMVSGFFSQRIDPSRTIDVGQYQSSVAGEVFAPLEMGAALQALATILAHRGISSPPVAAPSVDPPAETPARDQPLTQQMVWDRLCAALTPGNVVLADQGTSFYGMADHRLPQGSPSSANHCGAQSVTRSLRRSGPRWRTRTAGRCCSSAMEPRN